MSQTDPLPPLADPDALQDWNRRVRRLANAYAPKYRPLVLSIGYGHNLATGHTIKKIDTIIADSARWTYDRKPMDRRNAMRYLAEMKAVGALLAEERFRDDTGRQTSSCRSLDTSIAMDRHGKPVAHDFWAPFDESPQVTGKFTTPHTTPGTTPQTTPRTTRTVSDLSENYQGTSSYLSPAARGDGEDASREIFSGEEEKPGLGNIYIIRTWKSGKQAYARLDRAHLLASKGVFSDQVVDLSDDEASWMWTAWPAVSPEPADVRAARIGYLLAAPGERAALIEADAQRQAAEERAEREQQAAAEAEAEEERKRVAREKRERLALAKREAEEARQAAIAAKRERLAFLAARMTVHVGEHPGHVTDDIAHDLEADYDDVRAVLRDDTLGAAFYAHGSQVYPKSQQGAVEAKWFAHLEAEKAAAEAAVKAKDAELEQRIRQVVRAAGTIRTADLREQIGVSSPGSMSWGRPYLRVVDSGDITIVDKTANDISVKWTGS